MEGVPGLGVPGADRPAEYKAVSGAEHLRAAARVVAPAGPFDALEDETDVADTVPQFSETPRLAADLVEGRRRQIPCDGRGVLPRGSLVLRERRRIQRGLLDDLDDLAGVGVPSWGAR
jgi:hypothetical protein